MLELQNVSYSVDDVQILKNISCVFSEGFISVVGPNGAGKTTLLRLISGYLRPGAGRVCLDGADISDIDIKTRAKKMALVPQSFAMDYDFTVRELVLMGRNPHKKFFEADTPADFALADECIEKAGISHLAGRLITSLSGGEWQRMVIARALCQQSGILLLDEPVANLDIKHQTGILHLVRELTRGRHFLCICVLHDLNLAFHYSDETLLLRKGEIRNQGRPEEVLSKENIEAVYETRTRLLKQDGSTYILPFME